MFGNKLMKKMQGDNKKKIENLVFLVVILIVTIVAINIILNDKDNESQVHENTSSKNKQLASSNNATVEVATSSSDLQTNLENILRQIQGIKDVKVFINFSESSETVAMYNENQKTSQTEETDTSGGTRVIEENDTQKEVIYQEDNGKKVPITQKLVSPKIEGAIITAKGAEDANVKTKIIQAVEAATGLATHKIQVFEMN